MFLRERNKDLLAISDEHARLVDLLMRLNAMAGEDSVQGDTLAELLTDITKEASEHFAHEESLMVDSGYSHYIDHRENHQAILNFIEAQAVRCRQGKASALADAAKSIENVMLDHMERFDDELIRLMSK